MSNIIKAKQNKKNFSKDCILDKLSMFLQSLKGVEMIQARIAQLVAYWLGSGEVPGSNPGKAENFSVKISNWIVQI